MTDRTNIEHFNEYFKCFVLDIKTSYPEYSELIDNYYSNLLEADVCNDDKYVKRFMVKMSDHESKISNKDMTLFSEPINILKNIDFKVIFDSKEISKDNVEKMWDYLQTLYVLGKTIISDTDKVKKLVENFKRFKNQEEINKDEVSEEDKMLLDMLNNLSERGKDSNIDTNIIENGLIGNLAKELSEEIDIGNMGLNIDENSNVDDVFSNLISGDNPLKFMNLVQTVGQKIQDKVSNSDLDQNKLMEEATKMMSSLQGGNPLFDNILKQTQAMAGNMNMTNSNSNSNSNSTRDRLRKKLEKRNENEK
tara:strand:+ start:793 stop:1713 length:921 start_codon:yes stop_codon:yes gene_type:complete